MAWTFDPPPPPVVRVIAASGEHGATITCTPWGARERLRYSDLSAVHGFERDPETGRDVVKLATLRLIATSITVTAAEGFPNIGADPFDPRRMDHLLALPIHVLDEVREHALDVQPLPGSQPAQTTPDDDEVVEDPTRTPSTQAGNSGPGSRRRTPTSTPKS